MSKFILKKMYINVTVSVNVKHGYILIIKEKI